MSTMLDELYKELTKVRQSGIHAEPLQPVDESKEEVIGELPLDLRPLYTIIHRRIELASKVHPNVANVMNDAVALKIGEIFKEAHFAQAVLQAELEPILYQPWTQRVYMPVRVGWQVVAYKKNN